MSSKTTFHFQVLEILLLVFFWNVVCVRGIAKKFYLHTQVGNPNAAWGACASYGATMVKIRNKREHDALIERVAAEPAFADSPYWIGLFHTVNNQFSWGCSDQLGQTYSHWGDWQPGVYGSLLCVEVRADKLWYSASCKSSYKFICQKETGPCMYVEDASLVIVNVTSPLATQTVNTSSECHTMCENFNSGKSCFYVLYRAIGECTLLESKPIILGSGEYSGYSRKCYSGETRTEHVPHVAESTEPPTKGCIAPPLTLIANQPTVTSRVSSDKTTVFADKTTVVPSVETTLSFSNEPTVASADETTTIFTDKTTIASPDKTTDPPSDETTTLPNRTTVVSTDETTTTSTDKTTIASPDKTTATPSDKKTTLPDGTTVVLPDKTLVVSLDKTTVLSRDETTVKENKSLRDFTTTEAHWTAVNDTLVTKIRTSTQSETTLKNPVTKSGRTSANRNTAGLIQYSALTSIIPNILSTVDNLTPETLTVRTSTQMKTLSYVFTLKSATANVASSLGSVALETTAETTTREVRTIHTPELTTANLEKTVSDISLLKTTQNNCYCPCAMSYSAEEKEQFIQMILDELSVDRKVTSAHVRTHTSAPDPRPSAKVVGCTGLVILVSTIVSIVLLDFTTLFRDFKTKYKNDDRTTTHLNKSKSWKSCKSKLYV